MMLTPHDLLTPVRLHDGRTGIIVGRTVPTTASPPHYDVRVGTAIETPVLHGALEPIGPCDEATLRRARDAAARAAADRPWRAAA